MLGKGQAKKVTVFLNEGSRFHGQQLYKAVLAHVKAKGLAGATVLRGVAGYTRAAGFTDVNNVDAAAELPLKVEIVDTEEAIQRVLPDLYLMLDKGLITIEDVDIVKFTGSSPEAPPTIPAKPRKVTMKAKQLSIHISEKEIYNGEPLYEAILKRFALEEFAGATVYRALEGFGAHHHIHRDSFFSLHREAPIIMIMIDTEEHVARAEAILDDMLKRGAVVVTDVRASFYGPSSEGKADAPVT